jgi:hypothetical protein
MPIIDIYLLAALVAGLLFGQYWPSSRRRNAAIVLMFLGANYGVRAATHERALTIAPRAFGPLLPQRCQSAPPRTLIDSWPLPAHVPAGGPRCLIEVAALPDFVTPFRWRLVARLSSAYQVRNIDLLDRRFQQPPSPGDAMWRLTVTYPNEWTPAVFQAAGTRPIQTFLGFSRFPAVRSFVDHDGVTTIRWVDVRFAGGPQPPGNRPSEYPDVDLFGATVRVGADGRVVDKNSVIKN